MMSREGERKRLRLKRIFQNGEYRDVTIVLHLYMSLYLHSYILSVYLLYYIVTYFKSLGNIFDCELSSSRIFLNPDKQ